MKNLFDEVDLNNLHLKNRLIRSATWEALAAQDGSIEDDTCEIYRELAKGGVGETAPVIIFPYNDYLFFWREVGENGMSAQDVQSVIKMFVDSAIRAEICGFDGVQIHAAHFFFLSRFISPKINRRSDEFGGSTSARAKILPDILRGIKKSAPKLHVTIKINCNDFVYGGLEEGESLEICKMLEEADIDSIEVSGNGTSIRGVKAGVNEGYFAAFAANLADEVKIPVICVGGWRSREVMERVLNHTQIELLSLSRPLIREPDLTKKFFSGVKNSKCISCNACYSTPAHRCRFEGR